jgi:hypothetical protein
MDPRRFDRNADQLSQIFWHFTKLQKQQQPKPSAEINYMLGLIQKALMVNDELAEKKEKGLI